jgi:subtilisin family serine protease
MLSSLAFAAPQKINKQKPDFKSGELLVKFKAGISESEKINLHGKHGSTRIKNFKSLGIEHVKLKKDKSVEDAFSDYLADSNVEYAEPNYHIEADIIPNDPYFTNYLWNLRNVGQTGGTSNADVNAPEAWDIETGDSSVVVAVIDTGIDYNHRDLAANIWLNSAESNGQTGVDDDGNGYVDDIYGIDTVNHDSDPLDDRVHGTHVAGTIGAVGNNGVGVVGINWNVKLMACKFLGVQGGYISGAIECLDYVKNMKDRGVNIVATNNSWGASGYSQALYDAINNQQGILFITSAGNRSKDIDYVPHLPASYSLPNLLTVAATDHNDDKSLFSNYGKVSVHVAAPGEEIRSTFPNDKYGLMSGTSMAAPHVTGLAALIKAQDLSRDWKSIKNLILIGGRQLPLLESITVTGKRIDLNGSLTCDNLSELSVLPLSTSPQVGIPVDISVLSVNCEFPEGPVIATSSVGGSMELFDDGIESDMIAGDGIFTGTWTPSSANEILTITSPAGSKTIDMFLNIETSMLIEGLVNDNYEFNLRASGGVPPYTWSISSGTLPAGLILDSAAGRVFGIPTVVSTKYFTLQVRDSNMDSATRNVAIRIVGSLLSVMWQNAVGTPDFDYAEDAAKDADDNLYITGNQFMGGYKGWQTAKFTASGTLEWVRFNYTGNSAHGIDVDTNGDVYVTGSTESGDSDYLTIKYDTEGNILWERVYGGKGSKAQYGADVAAGTSGEYYVTGLDSNNDWLTAKFDSAGNEIWSVKTEGGSCLMPVPTDIVLDKDGNVYVSGKYCITGTYDYKAVKYDPDGNEIWVMTYDTGKNDDAADIAVDDMGNVYIAGSVRQDPGNFYSNDWLTLKLDSSGNIIWTKFYGNTGDEYAMAVEVDKSGYIYVAGHQKSTCNGFLITKYNPSGGVVWTETTSNTPVSPTICTPWAIKISDDYSISVAGHGYHYGGNTVDYVVLNYAQQMNIPLDITTGSLPNGNVNVGYNESIDATGGTEPYTWSISSGNLPAGLAIDASTGAISGTPSAEGLSAFTVQVTDAEVAIVEKDFNMQIDSEPAGPSCADYTDKTLCNNDPYCEWQGSPSNGSCQDVPTCTITEYPEVSCGDGADNDCDGLTDGVDPDCGGSMVCTNYPDRGSCANDVNCEWIGSPKNGYCDDAAGCQITEDPEVTCSDGLDNDCDGNIDSNDSDCGGGTGSPEICDDGIDNDLDGKTDCADRQDCKKAPTC